MKTGILKKAAILAGTAGISALLLAGCASGKDAVKEIRKTGVVNIAVYQEPDLSSELGKRENGLMESIAAALGATPEYIKAESAEEVQSILLDGKADFAIGGLLDTMEISDKLTKSDAYLYSDLYVVKRRGDYSDSPAAFSGRTLAFTESLSESSVSWVSDVEDLTPVYIDGSSVSVGLSQEKIDGYVCAAAEAKALTDLNGDLQYQNLIGVESPGYVILMKKGDSRLLSGINTIIAADSTEEPTSETEEVTDGKGE